MLSSELRGNPNNPNNPSNPNNPNNPNNHNNLPICIYIHLIINRYNPNNPDNPDNNRDRYPLPKPERAATLSTKIFLQAMSKGDLTTDASKENHHQVYLGKTHTLTGLLGLLGLFDPCRYIYIYVN